MLILVTIAIPSFRLLFYQQTIPPSDVTVKAIGKQWFWSYNYPDHGKFEFDSLLVRDNLKPDQPRLLAADNPMVVPVNKVVRLQATAADVIHACTITYLGVDLYPVTGRL